MTDSPLNRLLNVVPTGPILEQRGEEAAAAESQRVPTKKRVHDAEPAGPPQRRQVETRNLVLVCANTLTLNQRENLSRRYQDRVVTVRLMSTTKSAP